MVERPSSVIFRWVFRFRIGGDPEAQPAAVVSSPRRADCDGEPPRTGSHGGRCHPTRLGPLSGRLSGSAGAQIALLPHYNQPGGTNMWNMDGNERITQGDPSPF